MIRLQIMCIFLLATTSVFGSEFSDKDKLIFSLDLIRHGDRTSIVEIPAIPHHWDQALGELTKNGMLQEFQLGLKFRKKYIEETHLLSEKFQEDEIYVRSTDYSRTIISAQSVLMGLYSPESAPMLANIQHPSILPTEIQPISIHTQAHDNDELVYIASNKHRGWRNELFDKYCHSSKLWQEQNDAIQDQLKIWSEKLRMPIKDLKDLIKVMDTLYVYQQHNVHIPEEVLSQDEVNRIISLGKRAHATTYAPIELGGSFGSDLLSMVANYLRQANHEGNSKLKYVLLSGHDSTILSLLSAMQAPLEETPGYASNLNFSLYESDGNNRYIVVTFNDQPVFIPLCGGNVCSLEQFSELVAIAKKYRDREGHHPLGFNSENSADKEEEGKGKEECELQSHDSNESSSSSKRITEKEANEFIANHNMNDIRASVDSVTNEEGLLRQERDWLLQIRQNLNAGYLNPAWLITLPLDFVSLIFPWFRRHHHK